MSLALLVKSGAWMPLRLRFAVPLAVAGYALSEAPTLPGTDVHPGLAATVGFFALLVASLAAADAHRGSTFLARPLWQELGRVSFAFYLVHLLVIASVSSAWPDGHPELPWRQAVPLALAAFGIALAIAWVLHRAVEVPAQRWLLRFDPARRAVRAADAPATRPAHRAFSKASVHCPVPETLLSPDRDAARSTTIDPLELEIALRVIDAASSLDHDDPAYIALRRQTGKLYKDVKRSRAKRSVSASPTRTAPSSPPPPPVRPTASTTRPAASRCRPERPCRSPES